MAKYIKANRKVAEKLQLTEVRQKTKDGCFLLWQADMLTFGPLYDIYENAAKIGALVLEPWEAREEQDGSKLRTLPEATLEEFVCAQEQVKEDKGLVIIRNPEPNEDPHDWHGPERPIDGMEEHEVEEETDVPEVEEEPTPDKEPAPEAEDKETEGKEVENV